MAEQEKNLNRLTLKWGSVKGWEVHSEEALAAMQKWASFGHSASALCQHDTPEQQQALLEAIDHMDEIYLAWTGEYVSREEAKEYVRNYGKEKATGDG